VRGAWEWHAGALRLFQAEPHVLEHVVGLEEGRVVVGPHRAGLQREHRRPAGSGADDPLEGVEVDPCGARDDEGLGEDRGVRRRHRVVDDLQGLAGAERADVHDE
jgi:hypothetical protein